MSGSRVKGITIKIDGDTKGLDKALSGVNKEANKTSSELKDVNKLLKLNPGNMNLVKQKFDLMKTSVTQTKEKLETLESAEKKVNEAFKNGDLGEAQYRSFQRELESTRGELKKAESGVKELDEVLKGTRDATESAEAGFRQAKTSLNNLGNEAKDTSSNLESISSKINTFSLQGFANGAQQAGQGLKQFGEQTLDAFREVDEGMDTVAAKSNLTSAETKKLFETINTDVPGTNFQAMGDAVGGLNQQFNLTGKELEDNSAYLLKFASVNNTEVSPSINGAKDAMALFHMDASHLPSVLDSVSGTAKKTGLSVDTIWQTLQNGAPALQNMGLNLDQSVNMLGMFEVSGVDASGAIAALTKGAVNFSKEGKTLTQGLQEVGQKMNETKDPAEQMALAVDTFGAKAGPRMLDMLRSGKLNLEEFGAASSNVNSVGQTFENQLDPIDKMTSTQNDAKMAMAELGEQIQTSLEPVFKILSQAIKTLANWFGKLPGPAKTVITVVGLLVTGLLLLMPVVMGIVAPIMAFGAASGGAAVGVGALMTTLLPIIGIIAAVVAAIAAIVLVIKNWGAIVKWLKGIWSSIVDFFKGLWDKIVNIFNVAVQFIGDFLQSGFGQAVLFIINPFFGLINFFIQNWDKIKQIFMSVVNGISSFLSSAWNNISNTVTNVWNGITGFISGVINGISSTISGVWKGIKTATSNTWNMIKSFIQDPINTARDIVKKAIDAIKGFFSFNISWPHIPMPHFGISPSGWKIGDLLKGSIPKLAIDWYAKGGVFTKPTLFATGNGISGVGEAGAEAVLPLNDNTFAGISAGINKFISSGNEPVVILLQKLIDVMTDIAERPVVGVFDANSTVRKLAPIMTDVQVAQEKRNNRLKGII